MNPADISQGIRELADRCLDSDEPEQVVELWLSLDALVREASEARDLAGEHGAQVLRGHDQYRTEVHGRRIVRHTPKPRTSWKKDELKDELRRLVPTVDRLMSPTSGEVEGDAEVAIRLFDECLSWSSAKVTALRKYQLDPDEFSVSTPKPETLRVEA